LDGAQSVVNPDKNAPELCLFGDSLLSQLIAEALLPLAYTSVTLTAIGLPWYAVSFSSGLRPCCNMRRTALEQFKARRQRKKLFASWDGDVLVDGTLALVSKQTVAAERERNEGKKLSVVLAGSDRGHVLLARATIQGSHPSDFNENSPRQLRRLLRSLNIPTTGHEQKEELLKKTRFAMECDDAGFDSALMPDQGQGPHTKNTKNTFAKFHELSPSTTPQLVDLFAERNQKLVIKVVEHVPWNTFRGGKLPGNETENVFLSWLGWLY
jgi:hypothetical protein